MAEWYVLVNQSFLQSLRLNLSPGSFYLSLYGISCLLSNYYDSDNLTEKCINVIQGKDAVLSALSALCMSCHKSISAADPDIPDAILSLILSACSKKTKKYREAAFSCLEQVFVLWLFDHLYLCRQEHAIFFAWNIWQ